MKKDMSPFYEMNGFMKVYVVIDPLYFSISNCDVSKVKQLVETTFTNSDTNSIMDIKNEGQDPLYYTLVQIENIYKTFLQ